jgi:hypothetical protein
VLEAALPSDAAYRIAVIGLLHETRLYFFQQKAGNGHHDHLPHGNLRPVGKWDGDNDTQNRAPAAHAVAAYLAATLAFCAGMNSLSTASRISFGGRMPWAMTKSLKAFRLKRSPSSISARVFKARSFT